MSDTCWCCRRDRSCSPTSPPMLRSLLRQVPTIPRGPRPSALHPATSHAERRTPFPARSSTAFHKEPLTEMISRMPPRSEEHTSELQSRLHLVCRLLLEKKKKNQDINDMSNTH